MKRGVDGFDSALPKGLDRFASDRSHPESGVDIVSARLFKIPLAWRFTIAIAFQLAIVASIPIPKAIVIATGDTIYLQTRPIDPYDILRGRYVTLDYEIEQSSAISNLPGYLTPEQLQTTDGERPDRIYLILEKSKLDPNELDRNVSVNSVIPWNAVEVAYRLPETLEEGQQLLSGQLSFHSSREWIDIGLGQYFIPESIGDALEKDIRQHQEATLAEVKVDRRGNSALMGIWVEERKY